MIAKIHFADIRSNMELLNKWACKTYYVMCALFSAFLVIIFLFHIVS